MNKKQIAQHKMHNNLIYFLNTEANITKNIPYFEMYFTNFVSIVNIIETLYREQQNLDTKKTTIIKQNYRKKVVENSKQLLLLFKAYKIMPNTLISSEISSITLRTLQLCSDADCIQYCQDIYNFATTISNFLTENNINETWLDNYNHDLNLFINDLNKPQEAIAKNTTISARVTTAFIEAKTALDDLTIMIDTAQFRAPNFHNKFLYAKKVTVLGLRKRRFQATMKDTHGVAVTDFTFTFARTTNTQKFVFLVNKNGTLHRQKMVKDTYNLSITKAGYATFNQIIYINNEKTCSMDFVVDTEAKSIKCVS